MGDEHLISNFYNSERPPFFPGHPDTPDPTTTLGDAIEEFVETQIARQLNPHTIDGIRLYLEPLVDPQIGYPPDTLISSISRRHLLRYLQSRLSSNRRGGTYRTSTIRNAIRQLKSFFIWAHSMGYTSSFLLEGLRTPRPDQLVIQPLTDEEISHVFETINRLSKHRLRNASVFALMLDTGIRRTELANLKKYDIDFENQTVKVFSKKKGRIIGFGRRTAELLSLYAGHFSSKRPGAGSDHLFLTRLGEEMTPSAVTGMYNWLKEPTGIKRINAHITRHTFATRFLMRGGDPFTLRILLGHSSLRMVATYVKTAEMIDPEIMKNNSIVDESSSLGSILRNYTRSSVVQRTLTAPDSSRNTGNRSLFIHQRKEST